METVTLKCLLVCNEHVVFLYTIFFEDMEFKSQYQVEMLD